MTICYPYQGIESFVWVTKHQEEVEFESFSIYESIVFNKTAKSFLRKLKLKKNGYKRSSKKLS